MKTQMSKLKIALASSAVAFSLLPGVGWCTRPLTAPVGGQVTALPGGHEIEVANHLYHIKQGSPAEKVVGSLSVGQQVHLLLDGSAPDPSKAEVTVISVDPES